MKFDILLFIFWQSAFLLVLGRQNEIWLWLGPLEKSFRCLYCEVEYFWYNNR